MEVVGLFLFIFVFGGICNFVKRVIEQKAWLDREKGKASHLAMARQSTKGLGGNP